MRISLPYLIDSLQKTAVLCHNAILRQDAFVARPRFLLPGDQPESGRLYISDLSTAREALARLPVTSCIIAAGEADAEVSGAAVFSGCTAQQLLNQVQEIFDHCESWKDALQSAAGTGEMRELLDEIEAIIGDPVILRRSSYAIVACSSEVFSDPALSSLRGTHVPLDYVNHLKRDPNLSRYEELKTPFFQSCPLTTNPSLAVNILPENAKCRLVVIPSLRPLAESDKFLLQLCAPYVAQVLESSVIAGRQADPSGRRERLVYLLRTAIGNENADFIVLEQGFSSLGWLPSHRYCTLSIRIASQDYQNHTVELLCNQLEALLPCSCAFEHNGVIAVFVNLTLADAGIQTLLEKCVYFLRDNDLRTGISNTFSTFYEIRNYHRQALIALDFASRPQAFLWIQYFSDVVLDYILEQSNRELPLHFICSEKILQIRRHDKVHQTDFYATLDCYIKNRFNAVQTAKELNIHRSTFLYRMERLESLFGLDLDQQDALLYTLLSMKMLELSKSMTLHEN